MIPNKLKEIIDYVIDYAAESSNDWFVIKKELINMFPPKERSRFSRRHYSTKKQLINEFDKEVISYWERKTGKKLFIDEEKLHPEDWVRRPSGWGLKKFNEERQQQRKTEVPH